MPNEGEMLAGHRLLERVGEGHYGEVWKAEFEGRRVAMKVFSRPYKLSNVRRETLAQYALGRLPMPDARFFPRVEHVDLEARPAYARMEYVEGLPLEQVITNPAIPLAARLDIGEQILKALAIVHANGFVHGDLSPMNVIVATRGDERTIKLIDVGFGAMLDDDERAELSRSDSSERPMGVASPFYAAPERFKSDFLAGCGKASDIFAFGKILYRLITGESPFVVKPVTLKFPALGGAWDEFIFRCVEDRPEARFADGLDALTAFTRLAKPERSARPYRTECPSCNGSMEVSAAAPGDRLTCLACGAGMEILFLDESTGYASAADLVPTLASADVVCEEAVKFCPSCGERIAIASQKCRSCGVWVDEYARDLERRARERVRAAEVEGLRNKDFYAEAFVTLLGYPLCWLPGLIMNVHYLGKATEAQKLLGRPVAGAGLLQAMLWLFFYMPLLFLGGMVGFGLIASLLRGDGGIR